MRVSSFPVSLLPAPRSALGLSAAALPPSPAGPALLRASRLLRCPRPLLPPLCSGPLQLQLLLPGLTLLPLQRSSDLRPVRVSYLKSYPINPIPPRSSFVSQVLPFCPCGLRSFSQHLSLLLSLFSCSVVSDSAVSWTAARQLSLSFTISWSFLKLMSVELVQFSSVSQSCLTLCDPMDCSTPGLPVHHQLPECTQTHVH